MKWIGGMPIFLVFGVLFGFGYGSRAPLMQSIWADIFQEPYFASIFGAYQTCLVVGMVGPWPAWVIPVSRSGPDGIYGCFMRACLGGCTSTRPQSGVIFLLPISASDSISGPLP